MLNCFSFQSVLSPKSRGFKVDPDSSRWDYNRFGVCQWAKTYDTYGDANVQHSREVPFRVDLLTDFLASLAIHLDNAEPGSRDEMLQLLSKEWPQTQNGAEKIKFALSLKAKERSFYYNLQDCKTSTSDSKEHDKRWERIRSYDDHINGSVKSACILLRTGDCRDVLHTIKAQLEVAEVADDNKNDVFRNIGIGNPDESVYHTHDAVKARQVWDIVHAMVEAWRMADYARRNLDCFRHNNRIGQEESAAAEVA